MKKYFTLLVLLTISSCVQKPSLIPAHFSIDKIDLTPYGKQGFLITPHGFSGEYESIGLFQAVEMPSASLVRVNTGERSASGDTVYQEGWKIVEVNTSKSIDSLFIEARKLGADAIIDLKIEQLKETISGTYPVTLSGYRISGFAIKRFGVKP